MPPITASVAGLENFIERPVVLARGPNLRAPLAGLRLPRGGGCMCVLGRYFLDWDARRGPPG
jgi:hypothetical protein